MERLMFWSRKRSHVWILWLSSLLATQLNGYQNPAPATADNPLGTLKSLSLEELSQIEVTSPSKHPRPVLKSNVAIFVISGEDIRRSGATSIPEALRLAPG